MNAFSCVRQRFSFHPMARSYFGNYVSRHPIYVSCKVSALLPSRRRRTTTTDFFNLIMGKLQALLSAWKERKCVSSETEAKSRRSPPGGIQQEGTMQLLMIMLQQTGTFTENSVQQHNVSALYPLCCCEIQMSLSVFTTTFFGWKGKTLLAFGLSVYTSAAFVGKEE